MKLLKLIQTKLIKNISICTLFIFLSFVTKAYAEEDYHQYSSKTGGNFTIRTWLGNNSVDQFISGDAKGFLNSKQSITLVELNSNYWFGVITQEQLFELGPLFGIGVNLAFGKNSYTNLQGNQGVNADLITYFLNFDFVKFAFLHDESMNKYLALFANYTGYGNSLASTMTLSGIGIGLDSQYNICNIADIFFKLNYIPFASSSKISNAWGANSELGFKWFINQKTAINLGYKAIYYTGKSVGQLVGKDSEDKEVTIDVDLKLEDIFHGISIGATYYF